MIFCMFVYVINNMFRDTHENNGVIRDTMRVIISLSSCYFAQKNLDSEILLEGCVNLTCVWQNMKRV